MAGSRIPQVIFQYGIVLSCERSLKNLVMWILTRSIEPKPRTTIMELSTWCVSIVLSEY